MFSMAETLDVKVHYEYAYNHMSDSESQKFLPSIIISSLVLLIIDREVEVSLYLPHVHTPLCAKVYTFNMLLINTK